MDTLNQSMIEESDLSDHFKSILKQYGYTTIEQVLAIQVTELIEMEWLTADLLEELRLSQLKK